VKEEVRRRWGDGLGRFELMLQEMLRKYVGAEARDVQFEYFCSIQKPLKASTLRLI
jgi:hypothetical protein